MSWRRTSCIAGLLAGLCWPAVLARAATTAPVDVSTRPVRAASVEDRAIQSGGGSGYEIWQTLGALAVVVGLIVVIRLALRRFSGVRPAAGAAGSVEVLGRKALSSRHQAVLVRVGDRAILVGLWAGGMAALGELGSAEELTERRAKRQAGAAEDTDE